MVFLTYEEGNFGIDSRITVNINVYHSGQPHDPDQVNLTVGLDEREVKVERLDVGVYQKKVKIKDTDPDDNGYLGLRCTVTDVSPETIEASDYKFPLLPKRFIAGFSLENTEAHFPSPGETIKFKVYTSYGDQPVDPDEGSLQCWIVEHSYGDTGENISLKSVSKGVYKGSYKIPDDIVVGTELKLTVKCEYTKGKWTSDKMGYIPLVVQFYQVWGHKVRLNETMFRLDMYVLDMDGLSVEDADVKIRYDNYEGNYYPNRTANLTTDSEGKASVIINHTSEDDITINVYGTVEAQGLTQRFKDRIWANNMTEPLVYNKRGGETWCDRVDHEYFPPSSDEEVHFTTSGEETPVIDEPVHVYLVDEQHVLWYGTIMTDAEGNFTVPYRTLDMDGAMRREVISFCSAEINGTWMTSWSRLNTGWSNLIDYLVDNPDPDISISVGPFEPGEIVHVVIECEGADGKDEFASINWFMGPADHFQVYSNSMVRMDLLPTYGPMVSYFDYTMDAPCTWYDGAYHATFRYPFFLPVNASILVIGEVSFDKGPKVSTKTVISGDIYPIRVNGSLTANIDPLSGGEPVEGDLLISGTAVGDNGVSSVVLRADDGQWYTADGMEAWSFTLDTRDLENGEHTLYVRSTDGDEYSPVATATFTVDNDEEVIDGQPGFGSAIGATTIVIASVLMVALGRRRVDRSP